MPTQTQKIELAWTNNTALIANGPDVTSPASLPLYIDPASTQQAAFEVMLPASATQTSLYAPGGWSYATSAVVVNMDTVNYVNLEFNSFTGSGPALPLAVILPPGGMYVYNTAQTTPALPTQGVFLPIAAVGAGNPWKLVAVNAAGVAAATTTTRVYVWMVGF
jgi:hypothetical protein